MNLEIIEFLLKHGANRDLKSENKMNKTAIEMSNNHCVKDQVLHLLQETKLLYIHKQAPSHKHDLILDDSKVSVGCCSMFSLCKK